MVTITLIKKQDFKTKFDNVHVYIGQYSMKASHKINNKHNVKGFYLLSYSPYLYLCVHQCLISHGD